MLNDRRLPLLLLLPGLLLCGCHPRPPAAPAPAPPAPRPAAAFPLTASDDLGVSLTLEQAPRRIVSLAPSITEVLFSLGLGDRIVGVTTYCKYPPEARKKQKVGGYVDASEEKVVALAPDLVFATRGNPRAFLDSLRGAGLKVFALQQNSFAEIVASIATVGRLCGVAAAGDKLAGELRGTQEGILARTAALPADRRPRTLMIVSLDPLFVAGPGSYQDDMLTACGARNVANIKQSFGSLSLEAVVAAAPEAIIMSDDENGTKMTREQQLRRLGSSPAWRGTPAYRANRVYVLPSAHLSMPGPRLVPGLRELARAVHPDLFPAK